MSFKLDTSKFKKTRADKNSTTMRHEDGHELTISHGALSPKMRAQLISMPSQEEPKNMAAGGEVEEEAKPTKGTKPSDNKIQPIPEKVKKFQKGFQSPKLAKGGEVEEDSEDSIMEDIAALEKKAADDKANLPSLSSDKLASAPEAAAQSIDTSTPPPEESFSHKIGSGLREMLGHTPAGIGYKAMQSIGEAGPAISDAVTPVAREAVAGLTGQPMPQPVPTEIPSQTPDVAPGSQTTPPIAPTPQEPQISTVAPPTGLEAQKAGINAEARALAQEGNEQTRVLQEQAKQQQAAMNDYKARFDGLQAERQGLIQDINEKRIDPARYVKGLGVGGQIMTAIGLVLGGMGAGVTHTENDSLKIFNSQIDRDIKAQEADLGKSENLLSANLKQFGNLKDAMDMTRAMQMDIISNQMKMAATKIAEPMAKARAQQNIAMLDRAAEATSSKVASRQTITDILRRGDPAMAGQALDAADRLDPAMGKELRSRYVPGMGLANTGEDAKAVKDQKGMIQSAKSGIGQLLEINKQTGKSFNPATRARAEIIQQSLVGLLRLPITGPGAMSEGERKMLENMIANPTNMFTLDSSNKIKLEALRRRLDQSLGETAKAHGLSYDPAKELPSAQQQFVKWARSNPTDPKAKILLEKLGLD